MCPPWPCWSGMSCWGEGRGAGWNCPAGGVLHRKHESWRCFHLALNELEPWCETLASCCVETCGPAWPTCGEKSSQAAVCRAHTECSHPAGNPSDSHRSPAADSQTEVCCQPGRRTWPSGDHWTSRWGQNTINIPEHILTAAHCNFFFKTTQFSDLMWNSWILRLLSRDKNMSSGWNSTMDRRAFMRFYDTLF